MRLMLSMAAVAILAAGAARGEMKPAPLPDPAAPAIIFETRQVLNLDRAVAFYTTALGMKVVGSNDPPGGRVREIFLGFDDQPAAVKVLLAQSAARTEPLPEGERFAHLIIQVPDIKAVCDRVAAAGGTLVQSPRQPPGAPVAIALIADPDGHRIELIQR